MRTRSPEDLVLLDVAVSGLSNSPINVVVWGGIRVFVDETSFVGYPAWHYLRACGPGLGALIESW